MTIYLALIHKEADSDFGVSFPDFPGCITAGSTLDEALSMAREALEGHIECLSEAGEAIPEPSTFEAIMVDKVNRDAVAVIIDIQPSPRPVRVNITMDDRLLAEIAQVSSNRSGFLAEAAREKLARLNR